MARNKYLTRTGFRQFLEGAGDEVVGISRLSRECPIATYLETVTKRRWNVSGLACVPQVDALVEFDEFKPPMWAYNFIKELDRHYPDRAHVSGNQALYVLDEAVK